MEDIKNFLAVDEYPYGDGDGSGDGDGYGYGDSSGDGDGDGYGYGDGSGDGDGYGNGNGDGDGDGYGYGDGSNIKMYNNKKVYIIDSIQTVIDSVHGNYAKGKILKDDLTTKPCYIAKCGDFFAHGDTLKQALFDASEKYNENRPLKDRITEFNERYPDNDTKIDGNELFSWHHVLTGSCLFGRRSFCEEKGLDVNSKYTVKEFISLTENAFGSDVIKELKESRNYM